MCFFRLSDPNEPYTFSVFHIPILIIGVIVFIVVYPIYWVYEKSKNYILNKCY